MTGGEVKGTVTPFDSVFSPAAVREAAAKVHDSIADHQKDLARVQGFISDNTNLINLVRHLPDELSHDIMVPFGGAAFFPGKLIHTNEFLVLLGEGYYADRTARQTVEILKRRGKSLELQVESLKAKMMNLEAEAKFFDSTATDAAEGLVEIMEDYVEEPNKSKPESSMTTGPPVADLEKDISDSNGASISDNARTSTADDEYAQIMAMLDEREKEELEHENASGTNKELGEFEAEAPAEDDSSSDEEEIVEAATGSSTSPHSVNNKGNEIFQNKLENPLQDSNCEISGKPIGGNLQQYVMEQSQDSSGNAGKQTSRTGFSARRSFTGSIIEHDDANLPKSSSNQSTSSNPAKPVSRFKMQKGNR
ncbi:RNA polymerase II subunit 5-mediating protein homolog isoform X2 [Dioscorea cayenensis subsp. rotundata]|uniref:RNA polymerase II subunit 5-mediating protein homolog isoform X2 n=1 Tax=Dioscorea cayennensis subsp. rotundata TaxID=55577 RepID=A0AB40CL97_DIOCR|nr:RNA polymerase II subunit 5-mediating protein homolog isoform X2 [Dioscorea cayenensis subsp. rotundata]